MRGYHRKERSRGYLTTSNLILGVLLALPACAFVVEGPQKKDTLAGDSGVASASDANTDANGFSDSDARVPITEFLLEAEEAVLTMEHERWTTGSDIVGYPGFEGTGYLVTVGSEPSMYCASDVDLVATCSERASYGINVEVPGEYYVNLKSWVRNTAQDSVYYGVDGIPTTGENGKFAVAASLGCNMWGWRNTPTPIMFDSPGPHTFNIWIREQGARIDQIVINRSSAALEPPSVTCLP